MYNGWSNFETWDAYNWQTADETRTKQAEDAAAAAMEAAGGDKDKAIAILSDQLKKMIQEAAPDLGAGLYTDLIDAGLKEINYKEIAAAFYD